MKKFLLFLALAVGLLTSASTMQAQTVNMSRYITLTVADSAEIKLNFKAAAAGTPVRIVSGSRDTTFTVDNDWMTRYIKYKSDGTAMTVYGDITGFNCGENFERISAIDVSHNTQLTRLSCHSNRLRSLDVSGCTQLRWLYCYRNRLRSLNVSGCTQLTSLDCEDNQLRSLNVSGCTQLTMLDCSENRLSSLDVSKNTQLTKLFCSENKFSSLDVSNNTRLTKLSCSENRLRSLDISNNRALDTLYCYKNQLSSLNVSRNTRLKTLQCSENQLNDLDVSNNTQLTKLYYWGNKFTTAALDDIYCALPARQVSDYAQIFPLRDTSSVAEQAIVKATNAANATAKNWKVLTFGNNWHYTNITTTGTYVCGTLNTDNYITLTVADSAEIRLNFKAAADGTPIKIVSGSRDTTFTVDKDWMTHYMEYKSDGTAMTVYGTITGLKCDHNYINLTAIDVSNNPDLRELICSDNRLSSLDLSNNTLLTGLACSYNKLTDLDLSKNTFLKWLDCWSNKLTDLDLSKNTELEMLGCSYNGSLSSLDLSKNTKLTHLRCNDCQLTSLNIKYCEELRNLDCSNNKLQSLDVSRNKKLWDVCCYKNKFTTQTLDDLYCSLPDRTGTSYGNIAPIYSRWSEDSTLVAATNAQNANDKNWKVEYNSDIIDITTTGTYECPQLNMNRYITLTVDNGGEITLDFKAAAAGTPVRIVSGSNTQDITVDTNWYIGNYPSSFTVTADGTEIKVYGTITGFDCKKNYYDNLTALDVSKNTQLTELYCYSNQLSSLDLSKNTKLTYLYCSGNKLSSFDLSKNTQLIGLDCSYSGLSILDLSKNTQLKDLACGSNKLTDLDLSKNTQLKKLYCWDNQLGSLDVSGCTQLKKLYCGGNQLGSLDLSKNTQLKDLACGSNKLTDLDLSKNTLLEVLYCPYGQLSSLDVSGCTQLKRLECQSNKLDSLDLSKNTKLTYLDCSYNSLSILDLSKNMQLDTLLCSHNKLISLDVSGCTQLKWLSCVDNKLSSLDVSGCTQLTWLSCVDNKLISLNVSGCTQLKVLRCYNNKFTTDALDGIYCALPNRTGYENGVIYPIIGSSSTYNDTVLATNAQNAIDKNWKVQYWKDDTDITTNGTYDCSTSVAATAAEPALTLYPNPVADVLYLSATARTIRVYDIYGIEVAHAADTDRIDVAHLPAGIYTVKADGTVAKMVKR